MLFLARFTQIEDSDEEMESVSQVTGPVSSNYFTNLQFLRLFIIRLKLVMFFFQLQRKPVWTEDSGGTYCYFLFKTDQ